MPKSLVIYDPRSPYFLQALAPLDCIEKNMGHPVTGNESSPYEPNGVVYEDYHIISNLRSSVRLNQKRLTNSVDV